MMRQLAYSAIDLALHRDYDARAWQRIEFARARAQQFTPVTLPEGYAMIASSSICLVARSPTQPAITRTSTPKSWRPMRLLALRTKVSSRQVGGAFKDAVLARGATEDQWQLFIRFMGRELTPKALLVRAGLSENGSVQTC